MLPAAEGTLQLEHDPCRPAPERRDSRIVGARVQPVDRGPVAGGGKSGRCTEPRLDAQLHRHGAVDTERLPLLP